MAGPEQWTSPSSGGTVALSYSPYNVITKAGSYWFAVTASGDPSETASVRYATNPLGTWGSAAWPAGPTGATSRQYVNRNTGVVYNGGQYAYLAIYANSTNTTIRYRVNYATDPAGTWSSYEFDATNTYVPTTFAAGEGYFAIGGYYAGSTPQPAFIARSTAANSTYTFGTATSDTGYDLADVSGGSPTRWNLTSLIYDGSQWISAAYGVNISGSVEERLRSSTSITGTWGSATTPAGGFGNSGDTLFSGNGYTLVRYPSTGGYYYASSLTGTWTFLSSSSTGLPTWNGGIAYGNGYWVAAGARLVGGVAKPTIAFQSGASPAATYTYATATFGTPSYDAYCVHAAYADGFYVAGSDYFGELLVAGAALATGPTYLRQRQSPVHAPSRVRPVQLRQRQRPETT